MYRVLKCTSTAGRLCYVELEFLPMTILSIGQCGVDGPRMTALFQQKLKAKVHNAADAAEAKRTLEKGDVDLIMVNRELARDGTCGISVIDELTKDGVEVPVMLVSDHEDAQQEAQQHGAVPGFGKAALNDPETLELIRATVED